MSETELTGPDILEDIKSGRLVVAPREATPEMRAAAYPMIEHEETSRALITWEAMLAASPDHTTALLSLVEGMEAQARESAMQSLADGYQAEEAYAAQKAAEARALAAEAERDALREALAKAAAAIRKG